jgi:hypothetical protein
MSRLTDIHLQHPPSFLWSRSSKDLAPAEPKPCSSRTNLCAHAHIHAPARVTPRWRWSPPPCRCAFHGSNTLSTPHVHTPSLSSEPSHRRGHPSIVAVELGSPCQTEPRRHRAGDPNQSLPSFLAQKPAKDPPSTTLKHPVLP